MLRPANGMKCFILSLHRTGTRSTVQYLNSFLSVSHYVGKEPESKVLGRETDLEFVADVLDPVFQTYDAVADVPIPVLYQQLFHRYPTAKFILLCRNPFDWVRSVRRHVGERRLHPYERIQYWHYFTWKPLRLAGEVDDQQLLRMNAMHTAQIIDFFAEVAPHKLRIFELGSEDTGVAMGSFLGVPTRNLLPHVNFDVSSQFFNRDRAPTQATV